MLEPRRYSERLGTITHEQLQAALDRFALGRLVSAEPASGGLFGQVILIQTDRGGYALRGNPHAGQLERELYVARLIHERTSVPVPWPYLVDESDTIFGWPYAVMPRMPGVALADGEVRRTLTAEDRMGIARALAECLAALHAAPFEFCGAYDASSGRHEPAVKPFAEWFGDWTRWWLDQCRAASDVTTDDDVAWVHGIIAAARDALAEPFTPALVHTDFSEGNVVAEKREGRWRITGVLDLAEMNLSDGEYDLARAYCGYVRRPELARAYIETYTRLRPPRPGFRERMRHYVLHDRLIIWEYAQRNGMWVRPGEPLRPWAEQWLDLPELAPAPA